MDSVGRHRVGRRLRHQHRPLETGTTARANDLALDCPHVAAVLALEPIEFALAIGWRHRRTASAVALRAGLTAVAERGMLELGHRGTDDTKTEREETLVG